jgi:HEAT repeat protein
MAKAETSVKPIGVGELRGVVVDTDELQKGTRIFDEHGLLNLARHANKLFCEAKGSGPSPYRVSLAFGDGALDVKAKCTCPAARSRSFCKHAAALLVAWARAPEAFVVSDAPPAGAPGEAAKKAVKRGAAAASDLMRQGVEQIATLVRDLGVAGVAAMGDDRAPMVQTLGENLREYKLRRLSAKTLDLAKLLAAGAARRGSLPALAYTDLLADLLLTSRKLEKHLGAGEDGEPLDDRHVEELVGKTWQKADRKPIAGLDLVEYAYLSRVTSDEFVIRESRFFDLASGAHYSEKQIVPGFLAKRTDPKPSRGGAVLAGVRGSIYPGYPPTRLDVTDLGDKRAIEHAALARLVDKALPDVGSALAALQEHRRDVFAPDLLPVALRVDTLFARKGRVQAVDAKGHALHLPEDRALEDRLGATLGGARLGALIGDLGIDAALPTLWPMAAVIEGPLGLELRPLTAPAGAAARAAGPEAGSAAWAAVARAAGASGAAITLAEVREELADAFVVGLAALGARVAGPLEARLRDLGLEKQAALLRSIAERPSAEAKLDDFVKLYQVLGIALVRLAGATEVDRATMERVPTYDSVYVARPSRWLDPREIAAARAAGAIDRYEAAVHYARYYESLPPAELSASIYPTWADGSAAPYVVRAFAGRREEGLRAAQRALAGKRGRVAKITALRVLGAVGGLEAERVLHEVATRERDIGLRGLAADAIDAIELRTLGAEAVQRRRAPTLAKVAEATQLLASASTKDVREAAVHALVQLGHLSAVPALRQAFLADAAQDVRREAALALALLGDTEMVDTLVGMLSRRHENEREAKIAADALGQLGDARGLRELLAAYAEGYKPAVVAEALRAMGPVAIEPLLELIEAEPAIADRRAALSVLAELPDHDLAATLVARLRDRAGAHDGGSAPKPPAPGSATFAELAALYLKLAGVHPDCRRAVGKAVIEAIGDLDGHKALAKAARKAMA